MSAFIQPLDRMSGLEQLIPLDDYHRDAVDPQRKCCSQAAVRVANSIAGCERPWPRAEAGQPLHGRDRAAFRREVDGLPNLEVLNCHRAHHPL